MFKYLRSTFTALAILGLLATVSSSALALGLGGGGGLHMNPPIGGGPYTISPPIRISIPIGPPVVGGTVQGYKFYDLNENGQWNSGEPRLGGWVIYADLNNNNLYTPGEPYTITAQNTGAYSLHISQNGTFAIREVFKLGHYGHWVQSLPGEMHDNEYTVTFNGSMGFDQHIFGNYWDGWMGVPLTDMCHHIDGDIEQPLEYVLADESWLFQHGEEEGLIYGITDLNWDEQLNSTDCELYQ